MRSKVQIAGHPLHPVLVTIPIGSFALALVADLWATYGRLTDGAAVARFAIGVGIISALFAAIVGLVDYLGLPLPEGTRKIATWHLVCNLLVVALYAASWWFRGDPMRLGSARALSYLAFAILLLSGWLGGELVFKGRVGVDEPAAGPPRR